MKMVFSIIIYTFGIACLFSPSLSRPLSTEVLQDNSSNQSNASDIPAYVMELYTELSMMEPYDLLPSDSYNTIRSLENIPSDCKYNLMYQFTFDISAIADREHVLKSALRVYFENNQSSDVQSNDRILATLGDMNGTTITNKILDGLSSQWMEFDVGSIVDSWKASGVFNIAPQGFTIQLDYLHDNGPHTNIKCSDSTYRLVIDSLSDINKHPLLIIYTHDSDQTKTDIFKGLEKIIMKTEGLEIMEKDTVTKRASATESTPISCGQLTQVIVTKAWLNTIFHPYGFMIIGPNKMELNLCGGSCDNVLSSTPHHAALLATYATRNDTNFEGSQFRKCCVPIGYNAMTIITRSTNTSQAREIKIERLEDATARRCGCIFTYDF